MSEQTLPQSALTAEQLLTRLLELISSATKITDLTPESLGDALGLHFTSYEDGGVGVRARLTPDWWYRLELITSYKGNRELQLSFEPTTPGGTPPMTGIADLDADRFAAALEAAGFGRQPWQGEHGRNLGSSFDRDDLHVTVATRGESSENAGHLCIQHIRVQ